jgi:hypothetical protein
MMDYKAHFDKFVSDIYKRFDDDDERRRSFQEITENYKKTQQKLSEITEALNKPVIDKPIDIIDNAQFINLMGISQKTAQTWRDTGIISFSQIGNKIYYRISDLQKLLDKNYSNAYKKRDHEK